RPASEMVAPVGGEEQARALGQLADTVSGNDAYAELQPQADTIRSGLERLKAAESDREGLYVAESTARVELEIALDDARRTYNQTWHQLSLMFDNEAFVESFFKALR
ncbi:MAG: hypothetical protein AAFS10_06825, partial [Myxococcota bacterium]